MNYKKRLYQIRDKIPKPREKMDFTVTYVCSHGCDHTGHPSGPFVETDEEFFKLTIIYPLTEEKTKWQDLV
jgi:hypothetical protein